MDSLVRLLAIAVGADPSDTYEMWGHEYDARRHLRGLTRVLQDEDLVLEIADRLCQSRYGAWENQDVATRNECIENALGVLDALRDLITEELT